MVKTAPPNMSISLLTENIGLIKATDLDFVNSLVGQYRSKGRLSEKQWLYVRAFAMQVAEARHAGVATVKTIAPVYAHTTEHEETLQITGPARGLSFDRAWAESQQMIKTRSGRFPLQLAAPEPKKVGLLARFFGG